MRLLISLFCVALLVLAIVVPLAVPPALDLVLLAMPVAAVALLVGLLTGPAAGRTRRSQRRRDYGLFSDTVLNLRDLVGTVMMALGPDHGRSTMGNFYDNSGDPISADSGSPFMTPLRC